MHRPLRIVLAVGSLGIGGTETQLVKLAIALHARGHSVQVVALSDGGPLEAVLRSAGVGVRIFSFGALSRSQAGRRSGRALAYDARELYRVWRQLREVRADVCHTFLYDCNVLVLPLAWAARTPVRVAGHRGLHPVLSGLRHRLVRSISAYVTSAHLCNSRELAAVVVRDDGAPESRVLVIPNGVEVPETVAEPAKQPARGVVVAQLRPEKGHVDLVTALGLLDHPPTVCLVGDGSERRPVEEIVDRLGLAGVVRFAGQVPNAARVLPEYQFAILPSHTEGLPNAVLEAMAAGLPVIATAVGGVPDIVVDEVTGILVPPRDPAAMAAAIARLSADPALRARLGAAARRAASDYSVPACVERHEAVYRQWLS